MLGLGLPLRGMSGYCVEPCRKAKRDQIRNAANRIREFSGTIVFVCSERSNTGL